VRDPGEGGKNYIKINLEVVKYEGKKFKLMAQERV
jgi:hypothetical protein